MSKYYFLTFGTYCSRLPGDERGAYRHNGEYVKPDPLLRRHIVKEARYSEVELELEDRRVCFEAMVKRCAQRHWKLGALNVRKKHVHALICTPEDDSPGEVVKALKTLAHCRLNHGTTKLANAAKIWERGYNSWNVKDFRGWSRIAKYILLEQYGNNYLTEAQWLKYSKTWVANPFGENSRYRGLTFDGTTLHYIVEPHGKLILHLNLGRVCRLTQSGSYKLRASVGGLTRESTCVRGRVFDLELAKEIRALVFYQLSDSLGCIVR